MDAVTSKRQKKMSQKQEAGVAEDIGGRTVAGSGAGRTSGGGDVRLRAELRVECKVTEKDYFVLQYSDLRKIRDQAIKGGLEQPVMQVCFAVPRSMTFKYAISPGNGVPLDVNNLMVTDRKRIRLALSNIQRLLLDHPNVTVHFGNDAWNIRSWTDFLKELEQERANNQHNR